MLLVSQWVGYGSVGLNLKIVNLAEGFIVHSYLFCLLILLKQGLSGPHSFQSEGLPMWVSDKESACTYWSHRRHGLDPWVG